MTLDPLVHQATRLRILALLHRNREVSVHDLRAQLELTEGNLGSHAQKLLDAGYIEQRHALARISFEARYRLTAKGSAALNAYIAEMQRLLPTENAAATDARKTE
jgi:DNA-binding MarR family transcriptional regulator